MLFDEFEKMSRADLICRVHILQKICQDFHWMARRYCDGRSTYATSLFNGGTGQLLRMGIQLNQGGDGTVWASDGMGKRFDGVTDEDLALSP